MSKVKFPLNLRSVERQRSSPAQELAFGARELACAIRFIASSGHVAVADKLRLALAELPPVTVNDLGCERCNGDVPLDQPDLMEDRLCRSCADDYDRAAGERREAMRQARLDAKRAA